MSTELSREELLNRIEQEAYDYEQRYGGCSRCTVLPLLRWLGLGNGSVARAAVPFAGGTALKGDTCGALLGGLLAVGLATADEDLKNEKAFFNSLAAGFRFHRKFMKEMGNVTCRDIQTARLGRYYDMADPTQYEEFQKTSAYLECAKVVARASRLAAEFILEQWDRSQETAH